jgi:hypothetical protein
MWGMDSIEQIFIKCSVYAEGYTVIGLAGIRPGRKTLLGTDWFLGEQKTDEPILQHC